MVRINPFNNTHSNPIRRELQNFPSPKQHFLPDRLQVATESSSCVEGIYQKVKDFFTWIYETLCCCCHRQTEESTETTSTTITLPDYPTLMDMKLGDAYDNFPINIQYGRVNTVSFEEENTVEKSLEALRDCFEALSIENEEEILSILEEPIRAILEHSIPPEQFEIVGFPNQLHISVKLTCGYAHRNRNNQPPELRPSTPQLQIKIQPEGNAPREILDRLLPPLVRRNTRNSTGWLFGIGPRGLLLTKTFPDYSLENYGTIQSLLDEDTSLKITFPIVRESALPQIEAKLREAFIKCGETDYDIFVRSFMENLRELPENAYVTIESSIKNKPIRETGFRLIIHNRTALNPSEIDRGDDLEGYIYFEEDTTRTETGPPTVDFENFSPIIGFTFHNPFDPEN